MVIGTSFLAALAEAVKVTVTTPLTRLGELSVAVTPEGKPAMARVTVPYPNELTRSFAVAFPADMLYEPRSSPSEKSVYVGVGAVHAVTGEYVGFAQVES